jgi:hypothetical protein
MAENNASLNRHNHLHPATFAAAAAIYKEMLITATTTARFLRRFR